jgi:acyl-coenzyme A synthetase/AMP-(fatty) acid ligase
VNDEHLSAIDEEEQQEKFNEQNEMNFLGEGNASIRTISFAQLNEHVRQYRAALQHAGVTKGDRVVGRQTRLD